MKAVCHTAFVSLFYLGILLMAPLVEAEARASELSPEAAQLIKEVPQKESYAQGGAVILLKEHRVSVDKNGLSTETLHVLGRILNEQAKSDYIQVVTSFNSYYGDATLDFARTISQDGIVSEVSPDATQIKTHPDVNRYTDIRLLTFSFTSLEVGSHFEYQTTIKQKRPIIEGRWAEGAWFHHLRRSDTPRIDPVHTSRFVLMVPEGTEFVHRLNHVEVSPSIKREGQSLVYTWEVTDLSAIPVEDNMPSPDETLPGIRLSSLKGWDEVDKWASGRFLSRIEATPTVQAKAEELIRDADTEEERIAALFYFIQTQIEYVIADLGRGGYTPHAPDEILNNRYGDCKDQVTLFLSLLKATGIPAYPALINPGADSEMVKEIPGPYFPHLIAYIPRDDGDLWLDTTSSVTGFPSLYWTDQGRWAFVIDGKGGKFLRTPSSQPEDNRGSIKIRTSFEDQNLSGEMTIEGRGAISDRHKSALKPMPVTQQEDGIRQFIRSMLGNAQIQSIEISDLANPQAPFTVVVRFEYRDVLERSSHTFHYMDEGLGTLAYFTEFVHLPPPGKRSHDYLFMGEFLLVYELVYSPPTADFRPRTLPQDESLDTPLLSFRKQFTREGDSVKVRWDLTLKQKTIPKEDYQGFYEDIEKVMKQSAWQVVFARQKIDETGMALEEAVREHSRDATSLLKLSRHYLTQGKYEEAKGLLEKAVNLDPNSGEVRYFFGMALTYLEQYEEGAAEMEKAGELGYKP